MANYFAPLAAPQIRNALVDFSPVNNALDMWREQGNVDRQFGMQQKQMDAQTAERTYQHGRDAKQDSMLAVQTFGKQATAVDQMQDPAQRAAAWKSIIARHGANGLTPEEMDPITGPKLMAAQAGQWLDPRDSQLKDIELRKGNAEVMKLQREAQNPDVYGKAGTVVQGQDGKFYSIQFGAGGQRKIEPLEIGGAGAGTGSPVALTPSKGVDVVGDQMFDKATGRDIRNVAPNIAGGEAAKVTGRETAEGQMALPKAAIALKQYEAQDEIVNSNIDKAIQQANGWTTGLTGSATSAIPGTPAHDLRNTLNTIKANLGFDKLQAMRDASPTGGALGQVSEMENILLQSVYGALEQSQSKEQFVGNLGKVKTIRAQFRALKQQAYEQDVARFGAANVPNPNASQAQPASGPAPATVPQPGEVRDGFRFKGGNPGDRNSWEPAQ